MAETTILDAITDYLNGPAALTRDPQVVAAGRHPLWVEPLDGVPAPGEGDLAVERDADLVVGLFQATGIATERYESFFRVDSVIVWLRARKAYIAQEFEFKLQQALHDKRKWQMGSLSIIESLLFRPLQPISRDPAQGYTANTEYLFYRYSP